MASLLAQGGAILLGKTNMHEFAYGITSENPHYGAVAQSLGARPDFRRLERRIGGGCGDGNGFRFGGHGHGRLDSHSRLRFAESSG